VVHQPQFLATDTGVELADFLHELHDKLLTRQTTQKQTVIVLVIRLPRYPKQFTDTVHRISGTVFCMKLAYCLGPAFFRMEILNMSSATSIILLYNSARMCSVLRAFCKRATSAWSLA